MFIDDRCDGLPEENSEKIADKEADYVLAVKGNQKRHLIRILLLRSYRV